jgi:hypothetical protein
VVAALALVGHLDEALAFYRSVGATRLLRQAEKLLAATA